MYEKLDILIDYAGLDGDGDGLVVVFTLGIGGEGWSYLWCEIKEISMQIATDCII